MSSARRVSAKRPIRANIQRAGFLSCVFVVTLFIKIYGAPANAAPILDGVTIVNSGSTNALGWTITLRSDGDGSIESESRTAMQASTRRAFAVSSSLALRLLGAAQAARDANAAGRACMKSVSFGTRLTVTYHGWTSPDLSCPPASSLVATLAADVSLVVDAARPPSGLRSIHAPMQPRRIPPTPGSVPAAAQESGP